MGPNLKNTRGLKLESIETVQQRNQEIGFQYFSQQAWARASNGVPKCELGYKKERRIYGCVAKKCQRDLLTIASLTSKHVPGIQNNYYKWAPTVRLRMGNLCGCQLDINDAANHNCCYKQSSHVNSNVEAQNS